MCIRDRKDRVISFLNPESDALGRGYQLIQSKIALGSGGLSGKGFLEGTQSYLQYLPEKQTDFIFTLIGEEFGFIGTMFIILLFFLVITICFYISIKSSHIFGRILSIGVSTNLFIYHLYAYYIYRYLNEEFFRPPNFFKLFEQFQKFVAFLLPIFRNVEGS